VEQCFAEKFSVSSVNQRMRYQNLREPRKRLSGSNKKTAALEFIAKRVVVNARRVELYTMVSVSCEGYPKGRLDEETWSHGGTGDELCGGCDSGFTA
jgi:hypothetical protein